MGLKCSNCVTTKDSEMDLNFETENRNIGQEVELEDYIKEHPWRLKRLIQVQAFVRKLLMVKKYNQMRSKAVHVNKEDNNLNDSLNYNKQLNHSYKKSEHNHDEEIPVESVEPIEQNSFKVDSFKNSFINEKIGEIDQSPEPPRNGIIDGIVKTRSRKSFSKNSFNSLRKQQSEENIVQNVNNDNDNDYDINSKISKNSKCSLKNEQNKDNFENDKISSNSLKKSNRSSQKNEKIEENEENLELENNSINNHTNKNFSLEALKENTGKTPQEIIQEYLNQKNSQLDITNENAIYIENTNFNNRQDTLNSLYASSGNFFPQNSNSENNFNNFNNLPTPINNNNFQNPFTIVSQKEIYIEPSLNGDIDMQTVKSLDIHNYDKLATLSCESFFIRNSYENKTPYTNINNTLINNININDESINSSYYNDEIRESNESQLNSPNNKIRRVIKTVVRRIIKTPSNKNHNPEYINLLIRKTMIILKLLLKKENKNKILISKNFFRIWKEKCRVNINKLRDDKINKLNLIKSKTLIKIFKKNFRNSIQGSFYQWYKVSLKSGNRINLAKNILRKIFIFKEKCNMEVFFKDWRNVVRELSGKEDLNKLKESLFGKIVNNFFNKKLGEVVGRKFNKWKDLMQNVDVKDQMMFTLGSMKLNKIFKKIVQKNIFQILFLENEKNKISLKKSDTLLNFYNYRHNNETRILKKKFLAWFYHTCPNELKSPRKMNVLNELTKVYNTTGKLTTIIQKIISKRFFTNLKRKADWENPIARNYSMKVKYTKYFLTNGEIKVVKKDNRVRNILWKYCKPMKYFFLKYKFVCNKQMMKDLEGKSRKWQIEEKLE